MKNYVLSLALSCMAGIAVGQVKSKEHALLLQTGKSKMPVLGLDTSSAKYNMPIKKFERVDSLAPMPGTENIPIQKLPIDTMLYKMLDDTVKVKDFKLKIDSIYPKKPKK